MILDVPVAETSTLGSNHDMIPTYDVSPSRRVFPRKIPSCQSRLLRGLEAMNDTASCFQVASYGQRFDRDEKMVSLTVGPRGPLTLVAVHECPQVIHLFAASCSFGMAPSLLDSDLILRGNGSVHVRIYPTRMDLSIFTAKSSSSPAPYHEDDR